jgi:hypothetical protein
MRRRHRLKAGFSVRHHEPAANGAVVENRA